MSLCKQRIAAAETKLIPNARQQQRLRTKQPLPSIEEIQTAIPQNSLVVDYFVGEQGQTIAQALQHAQRTLRHQGYLHPFYWAVFHPFGRTPQGHPERQSYTI